MLKAAVKVETPGKALCRPDPTLRTRWNSSLPEKPGSTLRVTIEYGNSTQKIIENLQETTQNY